MRQVVSSCEDDNDMVAHHPPGYIKTAVDAEWRPLTQVETEAVFAAMALKEDKIPLRYI